MYTYPLPFGLPSHSGYHSELSRVSYAIQHALISYLFYASWNVISTVMRMRWLDGITDSMDVRLSSLGDGEGQGSLACCSPWGPKESDMTERLN